MRVGFAAALLVAPFICPAATAQDADRAKLLRYGEQLAQECVTCHRRDGKDDGIPPITLMSEDDFLSAMTLYKTGQRDNKVMVSVAASLDESQMRALAAYMTSLGKPPAPAAAPRVKAGAAPAPKPSKPLN